MECWGCGCLKPDNSELFCPKCDREINECAPLEGGEDNLAEASMERDAPGMPEINNGEPW